MTKTLGKEAKNMCYGMYYDDKKEDKMSKTKSPKAREEKAFALLQLVKEGKINNDEFAQKREEFYQTLSPAN